MRESRWQVIAKSVRGAAHIRNDLPNQDAAKWYPDSDQGLPIIVAISDGHGSKKCFLSDRGSRFAAEIAISTLTEFLGHHKESDITLIKRIAEEKLPKEIVKRWRDAVESDWQKCEYKEPDDKREPYIIYGATLLTVLVTDSFIMYLQLGDGDILTLWENGEVKRPLPKDERLFANETTSLCTKDAWKDFRFCFQRILDLPPKMILLATDGYANSFGDDESFLKVAWDIWQIIESEGAEFVNENLEKWLNETSSAGSGDDITVGLIRRSDAEVSKDGKPPRTPKYSLRKEPITVSADEFRQIFGLDESSCPLEYIANEYEDNGDGTITDHATGLMWQKSGSPDEMSYENIQAYMSELNRVKFAGYDDWRVPTVDELKSLLVPPDMRSDDFFINSFFDRTQRYCWTSDKRSLGWSWYVNFSLGYVSWLNASYYVRAVTCPK